MSAVHIISIVCTIVGFYYHKTQERNDIDKYDIIETLIKLALNTNQSIIDKYCNISFYIFSPCMYHSKIGVNCMEKLMGK